jgi:excisionase family DNA binding protein
MGYAMIAYRGGSMPEQQDERLTISRAAQEAGVTPPTIRRWIDEGKIADVRQGGRRFVMRSQLIRVKRPSPMTEIENLRRQLAAMRVEMAGLVPRVERVERITDHLLLQGHGTPATVANTLRAGTAKLPSRRSLGKWLATHAGGHGVPFGTVMGWFDRDPDVPRDQDGLLRYAWEHYHVSEYRHRGKGVTECSDPDDICHAVLSALRNAETNG